MTDHTRLQQCKGVAKYKYFEEHTIKMIVTISSQSGLVKTKSKQTTTKKIFNKRKLLKGGHN
jgi:uncharacterized ubiquitin-like protein YukD